MDMTTLIAALILVESGGQSGLINGDQVGILQQRPIFVAEVNRILGAEVYGLNDRTDPELAVEMAKIWLTYYKGRADQWTNDRDGVSNQSLALIYNRGYAGWKLMDARKCPFDPYWLKVKEALEGMK